MTSLCSHDLAVVAGLYLAGNGDAQKLAARQQLAVEASGAADVFAALPYGSNTILGGDHFLMTSGAEKKNILHFYGLM